ncbi:MAG: Gfo/Idh/MocA family oxidoreductase [Pseudomonadota bacterium]
MWLNWQARHRLRKLGEQKLKTVKIGLVGLGYMGKIHLKNSLRLKSIAPVAACDVTAKGCSFARSIGVKEVYHDYRELLKNPEIDGIVISLPTHLHAECSELAAEAGKNILLEKPLARNSAEGEKIVQVCRKNGVKLMMGYHFRFSPQFLQLKHMLAKGTLGQAQVAHATMVGPGPFFHRAEGYAPRPVPSWWFDKELTGGGALIDLGSHMIDLVQWYFGRIEEVKAYVGHRFNLDFEDYALCVCKTKSGTVATVTVGWFSREASAKVEIFGSSKFLSAKRVDSNKAVSLVQMILGLSPAFNLPYIWELQHFVDCIQNDRTPLSAGEDGLADLQAILLAYKNAVHLEESI